MPLLFNSCGQNKSASVEMVQNVSQPNSFFQVLLSMVKFPSLILG